MWSSPSTPSSISMNAPYLVVLVTLPVHAHPRLVTRLEVDPGVRLRLLQPQGDPAALAVEADDLHLQEVPHLAQVARMPDLAVAHVRHVHQAVEPPQVHEDAVVGDVLDPGLDRVAFLDMVEDPLAEDVPLLLEVRPAGDDHVRLLAGELEDLELALDADDRVVVPHRPQVDLAPGEERLHADVHGVPALDLRHDGALHGRALVEHLLEVVPHADLDDLRAGKPDEPLRLVVPFRHHLDREPGGEGGALLLGEVFQGKHPLGLLVDVDGDVFLQHLDDLAVYDLALLGALEAGREHPGEIFLPRRRPSACLGIRVHLFREVYIVVFVFHAGLLWLLSKLILYTVTRYR